MSIFLTNTPKKLVAIKELKLVFNLKPFSTILRNLANEVILRHDFK